MLEKIIALLINLPQGLMIFIVGALPVTELRGAIPLGLFGLNQPPVKVILFSIAGNLLPVAPLLFLLKPLSRKMRRFVLWRRFFDWLFERTRKKATLVQRYEALGLALFVAVPLPVTGAWTGCIAASLFKIRFRYAFLAISIGVLLAAGIVTLICLSGQEILTRIFLAY